MQAVVRTVYLAEVVTRIPYRSTRETVVGKYRWRFLARLAARFAAFRASTRLATGPANWRVSNVKTWHVTGAA